MYDTDFDDLAMEAVIWPWLDSDCMADPTCEVDPGTYWDDDDELDAYDLPPYSDGY